MDFETYSHRNCDMVFYKEKHQHLWTEITDVLSGIGDQEVCDRHTAMHSGAKSLSYAINDLIHDRLVALGWAAESFIFADPKYRRKNTTRWRLDFAKEEISIEVAFNHGEAVAWNLIKPQLASDLNHVAKAIQTSAGVVITVTEAMKKAGGFDGAVGTFESYIRYLMPMNNILTVPIMLVGLKPPETFCVTHEKVGDEESGYKNIGHISPLTPLA